MGSALLAHTVPVNSEHALRRGLACREAVAIREATCAATQKQGEEGNIGGRFINSGKADSTA